MAIDECEFTFQQLVTEQLPKDMERMRKAIKQARPMAMFARYGVGPKSILRELDLHKDFTGCYVLLEQGTPMYVGISRTVIQRLLQQVKGRTHNSASLAYRIAFEKHPHNLSRSEAMKTPEFKEAFENYSKAADNAAKVGDDRLEIFAANRDRVKEALEEAKTE